MFFEEAKRILSRRKKKLFQLGARTLALFGSVARNEASAKSDVDILVEFDAKRGLFDFIGLKHYLEAQLGCKVDLVTKNALHPALKEQILQEAKHVF